MGFTETRALDIYYGADRKPRDINGKQISFIGEDAKGSHLATEIRFHFTDIGELVTDDDGSYAVTIIAKRADGQLRFDLCEKVGVGSSAYYRAELNNWYIEKHGTVTLDVKVYHGTITIDPETSVLTPSAGTRIIVGTTFTFDVKYAPTPSTQVEADELSTLEAILLLVEAKPYFQDIIKVTDTLPDVSGGDYDDMFFLVTDGVDDTKGTLYVIRDGVAELADIAYDNSDSTISAITIKTAIDELDADVIVEQGRIDDIISGDQVVGKATADDDGNDIVDTYATKSALGTEEGRIDDILDGTLIAKKAEQDKDGLDITTNYLRVGDYPNFIPYDEKGVADGVATLDSSGLLPNAQLQSDVALMGNKNNQAFVYWDENTEKLKCPSSDYARWDEVNEGVRFRAVYTDHVINRTSSSLGAISMDDDTIWISCYRPDNTPAVSIFYDEGTGHFLDFIWKTYGDVKAFVDKDGSFTTLGNISIGGDLNIAGNIIQEGTTYETHAEQVYTTKDHIILRDGAIGGLAVGSYAGLIAKIPDGTNDAGLIFDGNGYGKIGDITYEDDEPVYSGMQMLATREDSPNSNGIPFWNGSAYRFDTNTNVIGSVEDVLNVPLTINAKTGQTANLQDWKVANTKKFEINKDGNILQNTAPLLTRLSNEITLGDSSTTKNTLYGRTDIFNGGLSLIVGAETNANTRNNNTTKYGRIAVPHYANAEKPVGFFMGVSDSAENSVLIGGGSSLFNATNVIRFFTTTNTTTATGNEVMRITSAGNVGIGETTPTAQLQVKSSATNKVPLIVDSVASLTADLQQWKVNNVNRLVIKATGDIQTSNGLSNIVSSNNSSIKIETTGTTISRNIADANNTFAALKINNQQGNGDIVKFQFGGSDKARIDKDGRFYTAYGMYNATATTNSIVSVEGDGTHIYRNTNDANQTKAALYVDTKQGVGDIIKFQYNGTDKLAINKDGVLVDNDGSAGTDGQILQKVSGEMLWTDKSAYAGPTETLLGSRSTNGTLSVTDIDTYDELVLDLGDAGNGFGNSRSIFKVQSSTDYIYVISSYNIEDSVMVSASVTRNADGDSLTIAFYNQDANALTLKVYGRNW